MNILQDQTCLITGASRGLGAQIADSFWNAGANLILVARSADALGQLAGGLPKRTEQRVVTIVANLTDPDVPAQILAEARRQFDALDVLVNNAAIQGPVGLLWQNDWAEWQATIQVNLLAPVALCRLAGPWMSNHAQRSKIINLSGGGGTGPRPNVSAYATAKSGLIRFAETLAEEVRDSMDVNCIAPGAMKTAMLESLLAAGPEAAGQKEYAQALKVRDSGGTDPARAVALCVFLASSASDGITGKLISAVWDPWEHFPEHLDDLKKTDIYTLRRIVPKDRGMDWGDV
ncbi:MAG: SDR family oxidoreductase [Anaerolineales bacterium]|nr:SDR family oxidoreductase [Anaerolineales bacterium]